MRRATVLALLLTASPIVLAAQQATGPAACTKDATDWFNVAYKAARDSAALPGGKPADTRGLLAQRTDRIKACAATFSIDQTSGAELLPLSALYSSVGLDSLAGAAVDKRLRETNLSESDRAAALVSKIGSLTKPDTLVIARAEPYMKQLDALSDAVLPQKLEAHQRLNGEYRYLDVNPRIKQHSLAIIALGRKVKAATPVAGRALDPGSVAWYSLVGAYTNLAEVYADMGQMDSTFATLDRVLVDHPEIRPQDADTYIKEERERYQLVGKPAVAINAGHWLNASNGTTSWQPTGKVTVVEFTAHWCIPCRNSYPSMVDMAAKFGKQGVDFMFATEFYGYIGTKQNLTPEQEFDGDREYFVQEHDINFPVAIADKAPPYVPGKPLVREPNSENYKVGGIPQTVIIDKNGIIRRILTGWDTGNAQRMPVLLAQLLSEKPVRVTPQ